MSSRGIGMALLALAISTGTALAQSGTPAPPADAQEKTPVQVQTPAQTPAQPQTAAPGQAVVLPTDAAGKSAHESALRLAAIRERGKNLPAKEKEDAAKQAETVAREVDQEAAAKGDGVVSGRIASEFGMTPDALQSERARLNTGWGDLMIAHTLIAGAKSELTVDQLYQMRNEGMGWGEIAHGMGLHVGHAMTGISLEGRVARGFLKPDGKSAKIASMGEGPTSAKAANKATSKANKAASKTEAQSRETKAVETGAPAVQEQPKGQSGK